MIILERGGMNLLNVSEKNLLVATGFTYHIIKSGIKPPSRLPINLFDINSIRHGITEGNVQSDAQKYISHNSCRNTEDASTQTFPIQTSLLTYNNTYSIKTVSVHVHVIFGELKFLFFLFLDLTRIRPRLRPEERWPWWRPSWRRLPSCRRTERRSSPWECSVDAVADAQTLYAYTE